MGTTAMDARKPPIRVKLLLAGMVLALLTPLLFVESAVAGTGHITGHVENAAHTALQGICVSASPAAGGAGYGSAQTNASGNYDIGALASGSFKVTFSDCTGHSYVTQYYNGKPDFQSADPVTVTEPDTTAGIDATLQPGGHITGHVENAAHTALQGICVSVSETSSGGQGWLVQTNASGNYEVGALATGTYKVQFSGCAAGNYAPQWYNGQASVWSADGVSVSAPDTTSAIDATLTAPARITGHVEDAATHASLADVCVGAFVPSDTAIDHYVAYGVTDSSGDYVITGLLAGSYKVGFKSCPWASHDYGGQWFDGKSDAGAADLVTVAAAATRTGVNAALTGTTTGSAGAGSTDGSTTAPTPTDGSTTTPTPTDDLTTTATPATPPPAASTAPRCVVPKLKGKKLAAAKKALKKAHCAVGKVTKRNSGARRSGRVLSSKPRAGSKRPGGTRVVLVVGK
jgi:hypothetical protein